MPKIIFDLSSVTPEELESEYLFLIKNHRADVLRQMSKYIRESSPEFIVNSNIIFWLTQIIHYGIKDKDVDLIDSAMENIAFMAEHHSEVLAFLLSKTSHLESTKDLTILFSWFNDFYLSTFDKRNNFYFEKIIQIFIPLLLKKEHEKLIIDFTQPMILSSSEAGKSSLFILSLAVLQMIKAPFTPDSAKLVAQLLHVVSEHQGVLGHEHMIKRMNSRPFIGKSIVYLLANCLKEAARTDRDVVFLICGLFREINKSQHDKLNNELGMLIEAGPFKGQNSLHIILHSLISAAYIDHNITVVQAITSIIKGVCESENSSSIQDLFQIPITQGLNMGKTGLDLLICASEKAKLSKIPVETLESLIKLISPIVDIEPHGSKLI